MNGKPRSPVAREQILGLDLFRRGEVLSECRSNEEGEVLIKHAKHPLKNTPNLLKS